MNDKSYLLFLFTTKVSLDRRVTVSHTLEGHSTIYTWRVSCLYSIPSLILWASVEDLDEVWVFNTKFHMSQAYTSCHGVKVVGYLCSLAYKSQEVECHLERYIFYGSQGNTFGYQGFIKLLWNLLLSLSLCSLFCVCSHHDVIYYEAL